ncbi:hypothetical protein CDAR_424381 [Caerostris darwini]|uniref:Uncharacterized protein n=1 Tax=Caerostris darwini TaxID=1538125 RepID=A0AAV4T5K5_9ARAC|nr:hypothetical protein CDAR_424381 [Caerostris darwini]
MEASNEPADDPFPKTTSKGSFAPTQNKGNDDTLKIRLHFQLSVVLNKRTIQMHLFERGRFFKAINKSNKAMTSITNPKRARSSSENAP